MKIAVSIMSATAMFAFSAAALAHLKVVASTPAAAATVAAPRAIKLNFNEKMLPQMTGLQLTMTSMPGMPDQPMKIAGFKTSVGPDGKTLVATMQKPLATGSYRVDWHAVAADTHRVTGTFAFKVR